MYISIGSFPTIDIMYGLPSDVYQLGRLPPIFYLDYPPIFIIFRQPSEPFSQELTHALTPIVLGCPSAYGMHDANFHFNFITHANIKSCIYSHILNHTIMLCNFTFPYTKN